jgi:hypothetical protein
LEVRGGVSRIEAKRTNPLVRQNDVGKLSEVIKNTVKETRYVRTT